MAARWPNQMDNPPTNEDTKAITTLAEMDVLVPAMPYAIPTPRLSRLDAMPKTMTVNKVDRVVDKAPLLADDPSGLSVERASYGVAYVTWRWGVTGWQ